MLQTTCMKETARLGCFQVAKNLPSKLSIQDKYTWSAIISAYVRRGQWQEALVSFEEMQQQGATPDRVTYLSVMKACSMSGNLEWAMLIHFQIVFREIDRELTICNSLINMYCKCGSLKDANTVFHKLKNGDCVSWGAIIAGHVHHGYVPLAVELFRKMLKDGIRPSKMLMVHVLTACRDSQDINSGKTMHDVIKTAGIKIDSVLGSILVDMYAKHAKCEDAFDVLDILQTSNIVPWNAIIAGRIQYGHGLEALYLYEKALSKGLVPTHVTFSSVLRACGMMKGFEETKCIHDEIVKSGIVLDMVLGNCLVDAYCKCSRLEEALFVFENALTHDVVTWGALISGYAEHGKGIAALQTFQIMRQQGLTPNAIIFSCTLRACGNVGDLHQGRAVHGQINECDLQSDRIVHCSLIDMYTKCKSLSEACKVFDDLAHKDVITWATMITAYTQHGQGHLSFELFEKMHLEKVAPTKLKEELGNCLIEMYAKCGYSQEALKVLECLPSRDVVSWNVFVALYAMQGRCELVDVVFRRMQHEGMKIDHVTFTSLLGSCSHAGLIDKGWKYFKSMREDYGISPKPEHYNCIIDLLSRAGNLRDAEDILRTIPSPDFIGWISLLTSCKEHKNVKLGRWCYEEAMKLDPGDPSAYLLMANIQAHMKNLE